MVGRKTGSVYVSTHYVATVKYSLTLIHMFSWLGGREVTLKTAVQEVPGSVPDYGMDCYVCFFVFLLFCVFLCPKSIIYIYFAIHFCNVNSFSIRIILQNVWSIIRNRNRSDLAPLSEWVMEKEKLLSTFHVLIGH